MSGTSSLVESSVIGSQEQETLIAAPTMNASLQTTCNTGWIVWTRRWVQQISRYWGQHSHSSSDCERPDTLNYDFVMPTEITRQRVPEGYNEKTVRLAPNGSLYL